MEKSNPLPFSLPAFLIAPWPVPLVSSALMVIGRPDHKAVVLVFLLFLALSLVISYLGTATLVICLWLLGKVRPVTKTLTALTGFVLAAAGCLAFLYVDWVSSGPDSGPPTDTFSSHLLRDWNDPFFGFFLAGGLIAALVYDILARRAKKKQAPA